MFVVFLSPLSICVDYAYNECGLATYLCSPFHDCSIYYQDSLSRPTAEALNSTMRQEKIYTTRYWVLNSMIFINSGLGSLWGLGDLRALAVRLVSIFYILHMR